MTIYIYTHTSVKFIDDCLVSCREYRSLKKRIGFVRVSIGAKESVLERWRRSLFPSPFYFFAPFSFLSIDETSILVDLNENDWIFLIIIIRWEKQREREKRGEEELTFSLLVPFLFNCLLHMSLELFMGKRANAICLGFIC